MRLLILFISLFLLVNTSIAEEVCITEQEAVDLITVLDASEGDSAVLDSCHKLVKDLYNEVDLRDQKVENLTKELINSKQDSLKYMAATKRWRTIAFVSTASAATLLLIQILPAL